MATQDRREKSKFLGVRVEPELAEALDRIQEMHDLPASWVVRQALREYLSSIIDRETGVTLLGDKVGYAKIERAEQHGMLQEWPTAKKGGADDQRAK